MDFLINFWEGYVAMWAAVWADTMPNGEPNNYTFIMTVTLLILHVGALMVVSKVFKLFTGFDLGFYSALVSSSSYKGRSKEDRMAEDIRLLADTAKWENLRNGRSYTGWGGDAK